MVTQAARFTKRKPSPNHTHPAAWESLDMNDSLTGFDAKFDCHVTCHNKISRVTHSMTRVDNKDVALGFSWSQSANNVKIINTFPPNMLCPSWCLFCHLKVSGRAPTHRVICVKSMYETYAGGIFSHWRFHGQTFTVCRLCRNQSLIHSLFS